MRPKIGLRIDGATLFQFTHPHGVRPAKAGELLPVYWFQSTHPHGVRLFRLSLLPTRTRVSIHAPAWGATATVATTKTQIMFQSTHPHGVRLLGDFFSLCKRGVSIHAPARGATTSARLVLCGVGVSIHAPARGATVSNAIGNQQQYKFQSTHPHGVRH